MSNRSSEWIWCYSASRDAERWITAGATREEAIRNGTRAFDGESFVIAPAWPVRAIEVFPTAERFLEGVAEHVNDEYGVEDWPEPREGFEADYRALLEKYFAERTPFSELIFSKIESVTPAPEQSGGDRDG